MPIVPVDAAAEAITRLVLYANQSMSAPYESLHLAPEVGLSAQELYRSAFEFSGLRRKNFQLVQVIPDAVMAQASEWLADLPKEEVQYLLQMPKLSTVETQSVLGPSWCPEFPQYEKSFWKGYESYLQNRQLSIR